MAARPLSTYRRSSPLLISPLYQRPSHDSIVLDHSIKGVAATLYFFPPLHLLVFSGLVASRSMQKQSACDENLRGHGGSGVSFFHVVFLAFWRSLVLTARGPLSVCGGGLPLFDRRSISFFFLVSSS